ncbi:MAG: hypothetical protein ACKO96_40980, partial [Flammeovirgaceae bacterium]
GREVVGLGRRVLQRGRRGRREEGERVQRGVRGENGQAVLVGESDGRLSENGEGERCSRPGEPPVAKDDKARTMRVQALRNLFMNQVNAEVDAPPC